MTAEQRQKAEAEVLADLLAVEREECGVIELAKSQNLPADYRLDCDPRAILGFEWVTAPPPIARGRRPSRPHPPRRSIKLSDAPPRGMVWRRGTRRMGDPMPSIHREPFSPRCS